MPDKKNEDDNLLSLEEQADYDSDNVSESNSNSNSERKIKVVKIKKPRKPRIPITIKYSEDLKRLIYINDLK